MYTEGIRTQKYLGKSCYHRIKCITAAFLAALMWRRPLNSVFNHLYPQKIKKLWEGRQKLKYETRW